MIEVKLNKSFLYFLPIIYREIIKDLNLDYNFFMDYSLFKTIYNTYVYVETDNIFAISFKYDNEFDKFYKVLSKSKYFLYKNDYNAEDCIISTIIFKIPDECKDIYLKFINGKYSKFSDKDKEDILKFAKTFLNEHGADSVKLIDTIIQVLNKDKSRAEAIKKMFDIKDHEWDKSWEVSSIIEVEDETYILN